MVWADEMPALFGDGDALPGYWASDSSVQRLYAAGLALQIALSNSDGVVAEHIRAAIDRLDVVINELHRASFTSSASPDE
jgi:hypothetical protein